MEKRARIVLAQNVRLLRALRALSQEELAAMTGLHRTQISLIERSEANVSLDSLEKLAQAFDLNVATLLSGEELLAIIGQGDAAVLRTDKAREP